MKQISVFVLLVFFFFDANAQLDFAPSDPILPSENCLNCTSNLRYYPTGKRAGLGFGLAWELTEKIDFTTNLGVQVWNYRVEEYGFTSLANPWPISDPWPISSYDQAVLLGEHEKTELSFNFSAGQRFHFLKFSNSSIFFATNFNLQLNANSLQRSLGLSIEPALGWKTEIGQKGEYFISFGYDKFLTSFESVLPVHPGSMVLNTGLKYVFKKQ